MPGFDHGRMLAFSVKAIRAFADAHRTETFYGFSIDASLLCLNSTEAFAKTLAGYRAKTAGRYLLPEDVEDLRLNTGDWDYQGFVCLMDSGGFDYELYQSHYDSHELEQKASDYAKAMDQLLAALVEERAFDGLKRSPDFFANRVEHNY